MRLNRTFEVLKVDSAWRQMYRIVRLNRTFEVLKGLDSKVLQVPGRSLNRTFEVLKVGAVVQSRVKM